MCSSDLYPPIPEREPAVVHAMVFSVAPLLMWGLEFASSEKRQRGRRRPGWGHQEGLGRGVLFLLAKMSQDPVDDVLILNASDDFYRPAAVAADFDVYVEYSL